MRLKALALVLMTSSVMLNAQEPKPSSDGGADLSSTSATPATESDPVRADSPAGALPVSLDRIRGALSSPPQLMSKLDMKPTFTVSVHDDHHLQAILSTLDFKTGPRPPGGLYGYEQQQQIWNKVDRPLAQPYAAFSGGELITLAIEGLMQKYLGGALLGALTNGERERAERAAKEEVSRAIREYCGSRPDAGRSLQVCSVDSFSR